MPFDVTQPFEEVGASPAVATLDKAKPFEETEVGGHNFEPGEVLLDPERAHQHASPEGKAALNSLNGISDDEAEKTKAVSQLYVQQHLKAFPARFIAHHWDAVRDSYAKSVGYTGGTISEGAFNTLLQQDHQKDKKQLWATAGPIDRLKLMFGDKGISDPDLKVESELPIIGSEAAGTTGGAFTIPKMQGTGTFVGIINAVNKATASLTTPENVGFMVATGGAGAIADIAQSARVIAIAKATQSATLGTFAGMGAKSTVEATANAIKITHDPDSTHAQVAEAWADAALAGAMTAAASKGTFDFAKGAETTLTPEKKIAAAETLREQAQTAPSAEMAATLHAAADHIEHMPEEGATEGPPEAEKPPVKAQTPPTPTERPTTGETAPKGADYGIAARVSEERAEGGAIEPIEPGKGISAEESVLHGRELLEKGADPQEALADFRKDGKISADQIALIRAHGETLNKAAYDAEVKFGPDSPEYKAAAKADSDWVKAIKPMQTEWHKIGQAQQGQTEMDTGTFHGVSRAFEESTGRKFTPKEAETAKVKVAKVQEATESLKTAADKFIEGAKAAAEEKPTEPGAPKEPSRALKFISSKAEEARARIKARLAEGRVSSNIDPVDLADHAIVGAEHIAKGVDKFTDWSKEMVKEFGDYIKPHLESLFAQAKAMSKKAEGDAAIASHVPGEKWTPEQAKALWQHAKEKYIDRGITDPHDIRTNLATDFGLDPDEIHKGLASSKGMKEITDEVYAKQAAQRRVINEAKRWVTDAKYPGYEKMFRAIPESFFNLYTFGHGTVWTVTHTGNQYFLPKATGRLFRELGRSFRLMGVFDKGAYHERMMNDLIRDPNFIKAKRAGLENDPYIQKDEYTNPGVVKMFKAIGMMGNRGFDGMKLFRQFRFNQEWNALPDSLKNADSAKGIAEMINTATGAVPGKAPGGVARTIFFAPRLELSRWKFMFSDPALNANTVAKGLINKDSVTPEAYHAAQRNLRQKVTMAGVYFGALAINQGLLEATNSDQDVNFTDFKKSDWLDFKIAGKNVGIVSTMRRTVQFLFELGDAFWGKRTQLEKASSTRAEEAGTVALKYARGKLSPFASVATDIVTQSDYIGKPLPFSSDKASPGARRMGEWKPYTYAEYATTHLVPIPLSEAAREIWKEQGMDDAEIAKYLRAIEAGIVSGGTGAKFKDDHSKRK